MIRLGLLAALLGTAGAASAAEGVVAPVEVHTPLSAPNPAGALIPGLPAWLSIPGVDLKGPDSPAALAAEVLAPPASILGFAPVRTSADLPAFASGQGQAQARREGRTASTPQPVVDPLSQGAESGVMPLEYLGETSEAATAVKPRQRLEATESALRAPLDQVRDAPVERGESLYSAASRVWDLAALARGRRVLAAQGQESFSKPETKGASLELGSVPGVSRLAPLNGAETSPREGAARLAPSNIALILMDILGQRLTLSSEAAMPRLEPGQAVIHGARAIAVPSPAVEKKEASASALATESSSSQNAPQTATMQPDLPSFAWRAEAEWLSFGESGEGAAASSISEKKASARPSVQSPESLPSPVVSAQPARSSWTMGARRRRSVPVPLPVARKLQAALPWSLALTLLGAVLLAWPDSK